MEYPKCTDKRPCFARKRTATDRNRCTLLKETYDGTGKMCPFCKRDKDT